MTQETIQMDPKVIEKAADLASTYEAMFRFRALKEVDPHAKKVLSADSKVYMEYLGHTQNQIKSYITLDKKTYMTEVKSNLDKEKNLAEDVKKILLQTNEEAYDGHAPSRDRYSALLNYIANHNPLGKEAVGDEEELKKTYLNIVRKITPSKEEFIEVEKNKYFTPFVLEQQQNAGYNSEQQNRDTQIMMDINQLADDIYDSKNLAGTDPISIDALIKTYENN